MAETTVSGVETCEIVDPAAHFGRAAAPAAPGLGDLEGRRIVLLDVTKVRSDVFIDELQRALAAERAGLERGAAPASQRLPDDALDDLAHSSDGGVLALADCGTCTSWTLYDAVELNRRGCRTVLVTTSELRPTVDTLAPRFGMPELPVVEVPAPNRDLAPDEIRAMARAAAPAVAAALRGR